MTGPSSRSVADALAVARPLVARLDAGGHPEEVAADLIEAWSATENALRSLVGGSALSGQLLISSLRQRNLISLDQAHALLEFLAARDRANEVHYRPSNADIGAAKEGFRKLEEGLTVSPMGPADVPQLQHTGMFAAVPPGGPGAARTPPPASAMQTVTDETLEPVHTGQPWGFIVTVVAVLALLGGLAWYFAAGRGGGTSAALQQGIDAYRAGRYGAAQTAFSQAAQDDPKSATPHIWLGRVARDQHEDQTAARELSKAEQLEPTNPAVHREIGAFLLSRGRLDDARKRYVQAISLDANDRVAQGWLACTMARLGRPQEAQTWLNRAGPGDWSSCVTGALQGAPPASPLGTPQGPRP